MSIPKTLPGPLYYMKQIKLALDAVYQSRGNSRDFISRHNVDYYASSAVRF